MKSNRSPGKRLLSVARNLLVFLLLVMALEWWQSRTMTKGALPEELRMGSYATLEGHTSSLWSPDRITVLYVFAPWCGVCRASASNLNRLSDASNLHLASLVLSWDQSTTVQDFVQSSGLNLPVILGQDSMGEALGVQSFPSYFLIDRQGSIIKSWSGYTTTLGLFFKIYWAQLWLH